MKKSAFTGKAHCGCVYHAEQGEACVHDLDLARASDRQRETVFNAPWWELKFQKLGIPHLYAAMVEAQTRYYGGDFAEETTDTFADYWPLRNQRLWFMFDELDLCQATDGGTSIRTGVEWVRARRS